MKLEPWNKHAWVAEMKRVASETFSEPPAKSFTRRVEPVGDLVAYLLLPAELCLRTNEMTRKHFTEQGRIKKQILDLIRFQFGKRRCESPLGGRPQILCTRFSSVPPDKNSDWSKHAVDALQPFKKWRTKKGWAKREGIGLIVDDGQAHVDYECWWEKGPGFVLVRVFTGATT